MNSLVALYIAFFKIGIMSFGGGYVSVSLIQDQIVDKYGWLTIQEFSNIVSIAEITPGPIAINSATFVGIKLAGFIGGVIATLGVISPSIIIVSSICFFYNMFKKASAIQYALKYMRPVVVILVLYAGLNFLKNVVPIDLSILSINSINIKGFILFIACFILYLRYIKSPIIIIILSGFMGFILYI